MSACCHCRAVIQSYALPTLPWGPGVQTLWHTAVSCSRSFSVRLSPHACRGSTGSLGWIPKPSSFTPCPGSDLPFGGPALSQVLCGQHRQSSGQDEGYTWVSWFLACFDPKGRAILGRVLASPLPCWLIQTAEVYQEGTTQRPDGRCGQGRQKRSSSQPFCPRKALFKDLALPLSNTPVCLLLSQG